MMVPTAQTATVVGGDGAVTHSRGDFDGTDDVFDPTTLNLTGWWHSAPRPTFQSFVEMLETLPTDLTWCVLGEADLAVVRLHFLGPATVHEQGFVRDVLEEYLPVGLLLEVTRLDRCVKHEDCRREKGNDHELGRACLAVSP